RRAQSVVTGQPAGGVHLGGVLPTAEDVDVAGRGRRRIRVDLDDLGGQTTPPGALGEDDGVAPVRVRAQYVGKQEADAHTVAGGTHGASGRRRSSSAKAE